MDHGAPTSEIIRTVIQDFYESMFPVRSQFELPPEYRNRFAYMKELSDWRRTRDIIRCVTYLTLGILVLFSVYSFWRLEVKRTERYPRLQTIQEARNSQCV